MKFSVILLINLLVNFFFVSTITRAEDYNTRPEVNWTSDSKVDFCANSSAFDFRNAYWLGALSYFSYWHVKYANPIISSNPELILDLPFVTDKNATFFDIHGLGFGTLKSVFFSSTPLLPEGADESSKNLVRAWQPALPFEACIKPDRLLCFAGEATPMIGTSSRKSQAELDLCGASNINAFYERSRLKNIHNLVLGLPLPEKIAEQARKDKKYIENSVSKYESKKGVKVNLNWLDKTTSQRCEFFKNTEQDLPDTQAGIFENEDAITIAVRGAEPGNESDTRTILMSLNQFDLSHSSSGTGRVHRGFYKAALVMKNWLIKELAKINRTSPKSANKPIFITGHSLGGALANLIMYSLLEHNYSTKNPNSRLNLKALYTFGTPRVGDQVWAKRLHELAEQNNVGLYRIVNFSDPVPSLPCINYSHGGALVYMSLNPDGFSNSNSVEVILNPLKRVLNTNNSHINLANCAYETALYYPLRIKEMLDSHFMTSYYQSLSFLKNTLNKKLQIRKNQALLNQDYKAAEQLTYPLNCQKPNISNLSLDGVDLNYQLLKNGSEN